MIDPVVPMLVGASVPIVVQLARLLHRSAALRARVELTRAAEKLPAGAQIDGRDAVGTWSVSRSPASEVEQ
jgi:hypothetical protein